MTTTMTPTTVPDTTVLTALRHQNLRVSSRTNLEAGTIHSATARRLASLGLVEVQDTKAFRVSAGMVKWVVLVQKGRAVLDGTVPAPVARSTKGEWWTAGPAAMRAEAERRGIPTPGPGATAGEWGKLAGVLAAPVVVKGKTPVAKTTTPPTKRDTKTTTEAKAAPVLPTPVTPTTPVQEAKAVVVLPTPPTVPTPDTTVVVPTPVAIPGPSYQVDTKVVYVPVPPKTPGEEGGTMKVWLHYLLVEAPCAVDCFPTHYRVFQCRRKGQVSYTVSVRPMVPQPIWDHPSGVPGVWYKEGQWTRYGPTVYTATELVTALRPLLGSLAESAVRAYGA